MNEKEEKVMSDNDDNNPPNYKTTKYQEFIETIKHKKVETAKVEIAKNSKTKGIKEKEEFYDSKNDPNIIGKKQLALN